MFSITKAGCQGFIPFGSSPNFRLISDKGICPANLLPMRLLVQRILRASSD